MNFLAAKFSDSNRKNLGFSRLSALSRSLITELSRSLITVLSQVRVLPAPLIYSVSYSTDWPTVISKMMYEHATVRNHTELV